MFLRVFDLVRQAKKKAQRGHRLTRACELVWTPVSVGTRDRWSLQVIGGLVKPCLAPLGILAVHAAVFLVGVTVVLVFERVPIADIWVCCIGPKEGV